MAHSDDFEDRVLSDLAELKTNMKSLIGNGQPGRIAKIEAKVDVLDAHRNQWIGRSGIIAIIISAMITLGIVIADNYHEANLRSQTPSPTVSR